MVDRKVIGSTDLRWLTMLLDLFIICFLGVLGELKSYFLLLHVSQGR